MMAKTYKQFYVEALKRKEFVYMGERCPLCGEKVVSPDDPSKYYDEHVCLNADCDYFYNDHISYEDLCC